MAIRLPFFKRAPQLPPNARVNRIASMSKPEAIDGIVIYQDGNRAKVCWGPGKQTMESVEDLACIVA